MKQLYEVNGLIFWSDEEILLRRQFEDYFANKIKSTLLNINRAWNIFHIEAPILTPNLLINSSYIDSDVWSTADELVLRPETTPGSYKYAEYLLQSHNKINPPLVIWQSGKSFRSEQDQVTKNMRLKEFYQQEFQCIYTSDTKNDYHSAVLEPVREMIERMIGFPARLVESDRLPKYSEITIDVEVNNGNKWMEVCSISRRTDFPIKIKFQQNKNVVEKSLLVLEIAIGLDRCVYNFNL